jgi:hypothetical protein
VTVRGDAEATSINVSVDGTPVFVDLPVSQFGPMGLVTHWTPGRFDDVWFSYDPRFSAMENFNVPRDPPSWWAVRGTWDTTGGTLNSRAASANDLATMEWQRSTDYTVTAHMLNLYAGSGNRIGLVFGLDLQAGDYYEVLFAPTGQAYLNKFIQGQLTQVATATHSAGRNVWFNVELVRRGPNATVKVNNQIVFENVPTAQLDHSFPNSVSSVGPRMGVISHWAPGRFDDVRLEIPLGR